MASKLGMAEKSEPIGLRIFTEEAGERQGTQIVEKSTPKARKGRSTKRAEQLPSTTNGATQAKG